MISIQQCAQLAADTADISAIRISKVLHATNNPSLLLSALQTEEIFNSLQRAVHHHKKKAHPEKELKNLIFDYFLVEVGRLILNEIQGTLSTQLDPHLAYDTQATISRARYLVHLFEKAHIPKERIYIKIPATWQGMQAARLLEQENIRCNMTLVFSVIQAQMADQVHASMIAPYVGRVCDWMKMQNAQSCDFGVQLVFDIITALQHTRSSTLVMAASVRNLEQIHSLRSCDFLTLHPALLEQLLSKDEFHSINNTSSSSFENAKSLPLLSHSRTVIEEKDFLKQLLDDTMASALLSQGLQRFMSDMQHIEALIQSQLS